MDKTQMLPKSPPHPAVAVAIVVAVGTVFAALTYVALSALAASRRVGTLLPGESPVTAGGTPPGPNALDPATGLPRSIGPCRAVMRWSWHLRPREQVGTEDAHPYPAATEVILLESGYLTRNGATMFRVRVARDAAEGWAFVQPYEIVGDCRPSPATRPA